MLLWWIVVILGAPVLGFTLGRRFGRLPLGLRAVLAAAAVAVFALSSTSVSLPGAQPDRFAFGLAYLVLVLTVGALPYRRVRTGVLSVVAVLTVLASTVLSFPLALMLTVGSQWAGPTTVTACGYRVRLEPFGWVSSSGMAAVVLWRPWWLPLEVERARERFSDATYSPDGLAVESGPACRSVVTYRGEPVWGYSPDGGSSGPPRWPRSTGF